MEDFGLGLETQGLGLGLGLNKKSLIYITVPNTALYGPLEL